MLRLGMVIALVIALIGCCEEDLKGIGVAPEPESRPPESVTLAYRTHEPVWISGMWGEKESVHLDREHHRPDFARGDIELGVRGDLVPGMDRGSAQARDIPVDRIAGGGP